MKKAVVILVLIILFFNGYSYAFDNKEIEQHNIYHIINQYKKALEEKNIDLIKEISSEKFMSKSKEFFKNIKEIYFF